MGSLIHAVTLDKDKCKGCTNCIKHCPTEAIRVRDGKAKIIDERCIDCGECIRICPHHAKTAITDSLEEIKKFRYPVAIPAPSLYGQFKGNVSVDKIISGLYGLGFFKVWEVARGAEIVSKVTERYLKEHDLPKPVISSACPTVMRLIRIRYPELVDHILPVDSPMEVAAYMVKEELAAEGYAREDIGVFFISPCAAKFTIVKNPLGKEKSNVDGVLAISDIYGPLLEKIKEEKMNKVLQKSTSAGIGWAISGGESRLIKDRRHISVDGLTNVTRVLEDAMMGKLKEVDFIEALACSGGCVGGPLTVENPFMAKERISKLSEGITGELPQVSAELADGFVYDKPITPQNVLRLDEDMVKAIKKMGEIEEITEDLPGLDCGACGAPTCRALAEDIVRGKADELDCIIKLRENVSGLAERMVDLAKKMPPSMNQYEKRER